MNTFIVFLRGINVGGHNKIAMQDLRQMLLDLGFDNPKTYIQTGNVIIKTDLSNKLIIASKIEMSIFEYFGLNIPTLIKTAAELSLILQNCPFSEHEKPISYFALLFNNATQQQVEALSSYEFSNEKFVLIDQCVYLFSSIGYGKTKANNNFFEKKINIRATTRNFKTLKKVLELSLN